VHAVVRALANPHALPERALPRMPRLPGAGPRAGSEPACAVRLGGRPTGRAAARRGTASAAGLLIRSWHAGGEGGAALLYDWERGVLECVFEAGTGADLATRTELDAEDESVRRVGGAVGGPRQGEPVTVRGAGVRLGCK